MTEQLFEDPVDHMLLQGRLSDWLSSADSKYRVVASEVALSGSYGDAGRLDVVALRIKPGYSGFDVTGFEVKATLSDLQSDVLSEKWRRYEPQVHRMAFAVPEDLADTEAVESLAYTCGSAGLRLAR